MTVQAVSVVRLVAFAILSPFAVYCLYRHGRCGILAWLYLSTFCILRIVTGAVSVDSSSKYSLTYIILNSVGLAPLMYCAAGIIHESRHRCIPFVRRALELFVEVQFHTFVAVGVVLSIVGMAEIEEGAGSSYDTMVILLKVGAAVSAASWGWLVIWTLSTLRKLHRCSNSAAGVNKLGTTLITGNVVALPFIALRIGYGISFLLLRVTNTESGFLGSNVAWALLEVVPEILAAMTFVAVGLLTRNIKDVSINAKRDAANVESVRVETGDKNYQTT